MFSILATHLPKAMNMVTAFTLRLADAPPTDTTGINDAMYSLARLMQLCAGGTIAVMIVWLGYEYLFTDSASRGSHLKRSLGILIGALIFILFGVTLAPILITALRGGK